MTGIYGPPSDLVPEEQWHGLIDLPTDVLLRTSDNHGTQLARLYGIWGIWVKTLPIESGKAPFMFNAGWDAVDDFNAAIFGSYSPSVSGVM